MNKNSPIPLIDVLELQDLLESFHACCQDCAQHQSEEFDIPDAELRCLMLFREEKYLTPSGIASKLGVVKSRVTRLLAGLEDKGLLRRSVSPEDERIRLISLTGAGEVLLSKVEAYRESYLRKVLEVFPNEQRGQMLHNLGLLRRSMRLALE